MLRKKLIYDTEIKPKIINDYIAMKYLIEYEDEYRRESEIKMNYDKKTRRYLRFAYKFDNHKDMFNSVSLPDNERFILMPYIPHKNEQDRCVMYIVGASGSGKSYVVNQYCELYHALHKGKNKMYFFTMNDYKADRSLNHDLYEFVDMPEFLEYYKDEKNVRDFETTSYFNDSMFIFDDIGSLKGKDEATLWQIMNIILEFKRKVKISIIIISHIPTLGNLSELLIREIKNYVVFPANLQVKSDRLLEKYLGLSKKQINQITDEDYERSLWVSIDTKRRIVLTQNTCYFL